MFERCGADVIVKLTGSYGKKYQSMGYLGKRFFRNLNGAG
jgi:hypothetical protein